MRRMVFLSVVLAAAVSVACTDNAQNEIGTDAGGAGSIGTTGDADPNAVTDADRTFFEDVSVANLAEIELGKMASEKGMNAEVKKFGQMMVEDHTAAGDKLRALAAKHNVTLPAGLDEEHRELRDKLAILKGAEFDREYISAMVDGHEQVIDHLGSRVDDTNASAVVAERDDNVVTMGINQWAAEANPVVQRHLEAAEKIEDRLTAK